MTNIDFFANLTRARRKTTDARTAIARARRVLNSEASGLPMELAATKLGEGGYNEVFLMSSVCLLKSLDHKVLTLTTGS